MGKQAREAKKRRQKALKRMYGTAQADGLGALYPTAGARNRSGKHPIFATPVLYSDLTGARPTQREVDALLSGFRRKPTFLMLAMINALLSFRQREADRANYVQGFLFKNLIDDELFEQARRKFGRHRMEERPLFHRQQLLTMMRRVLLVGSDDGGLDPNPPDAKPARHELGKAASMMSDLIFPEEQGERLKRRNGDDRERIHDELFAQLLPSSELTNPPDAPRAFVRNDDYFKIFEHGAADFVFADGQSLADRFKSLTGLQLRRYLMLVYCIYAYYEVEAESLDRFINDPSRLNIGKETTFAKMDVTQGEVEALLRLTAAGVEEYTPAARAAAAADAALSPYHGFAEFRSRPLAYTDDTKRFATVIDMGFLIEKLSTGVYHTILASLEGGDEAQGQDRKNFLRRYWGDVFEVYVNDLLGEALPPSAGRFFRSPVYDRPKAKKGKQAFDAALDFGDALVVMEHKGKYLKLEAKYSERPEALTADLDERFGKGVRQLADNIEAIFNADESRRGEFSERDASGNVLRSFTGEDAKGVRVIYPVLVVQDFSLRLGFANRWLRNLFAAEVRKRSVNPNLIRPLSLLTIEDVEKVLPYLEALSFVEILKEYTKAHEPLYTFEYVFNELRARRGVARRPDERFERRLRELHDELKSMFVVID